MRHLVKSAIAQRYYERLNRTYTSEAARKQFNQDMIDLEQLEAVIREATEEEIEALIKLKQDDTA